LDDHTHAVNEAEIRRGILLKSIHDRIQEDPTLSVRRVYDEAAVDATDDSDDMAPFQNIRTRAKRFRARFIPAIPADINDVLIEDSRVTGVERPEEEDLRFTSIMTGALPYSQVTSV